MLTKIKFFLLHVPHVHLTSFIKNKCIPHRAIAGPFAKKTKKSTVHRFVQRKQNKPTNLRCTYKVFDTRFHKPSPSDYLKHRDNIEQE
jgi:hypothetical protein